jgi:HlyD family secretion protein
MTGPRADGTGRRILRWTAALLLLGGVATAVALSLQPDPVPVDVATAARGPMQVTVDEEGRTRIRERYVVSSPLLGRTGRITLDPGDAVVAGETVLAVIDPREPALLDARARAAAEARVRAAGAALQQAGAALEQARSAYDFAENELARVREAAGNGAAMPREVDAAESEQRAAREGFRAASFAEEIARFELQQAEAALAFSGEGGQDDEDRLVIRSPIDGVVLRVLQESAAVVEPGTELLEIGDPTDLEVVIDVLSADAVRVRPGAPVAIEAWGGPAVLEAAVRVVEPSATTEISALGIEEQRVNIVADLRSPPEERPTLGDGFRVEARILTWESGDVLQVPTGAVFRPAGGAAAGTWAVYVVQDGRARRRTVGLGHRTWRVAEITEGLEPGTTVIVHPSDRLADGTPVAVRDAAAG